MSRLWCFLGFHQWTRPLVILDEQAWRDAGCPDSFPTTVGYLCARPRCKARKLLK